MHRRTLAVLIGSATVVAACGGTSDGESSATLPQPAAEAPTTDPPSASTPDDDPAPIDTDAAPAGSETDADEPAEATPEAADTVAPETDDAPPPTEAAPATEAAAPAEAVLGGRAFASEITTDSTVLPDLLVDDIRRGAKVNLQNVFPAERPVLFWAFAPH